MLSGTPYTLTLPEDTPVNTTVFQEILAVDSDSGSNMQLEYSVVPGDGSDNDGFGFFVINLPHRGYVSVAKQLDFEKTKTYYVNIKASDKAVSEEKRRSSLAVLTVHVQDSDDQDPVFSSQLYTSRVTSGQVSGVLDMSPDSVHAVDQDTLRSEIQYSFVSGNDLTRGWKNLNPLSHPNATLAPQARASGENLNYLLCCKSDILK